MCSKQNKKTQIVFLYDSLMTHSDQRILRLPIRFLSFGRLQASLYWLYDKGRRYYVLPPNNKFKSRIHRSFVYGGIFVINDFEEYNRAFYSYYNCSIPYTDEVMQEDLFIPRSFIVEPIAFNSLEQIKNCSCHRLDKIKALVMFGNEDNKRIEHNMKDKHHKHTLGIDMPNFLTMIKEVQQ